MGIFFGMPMGKGFGPQLHQTTRHIKLISIKNQSTFPCFLEHPEFSKYQVPKTPKHYQEPSFCLLPVFFYLILPPQPALPPEASVLKDLKTAEKVIRAAKTKRILGDEGVFLAKRFSAGGFVSFSCVCNETCFLFN